jgi:hypothetical protein
MSGICAAAEEANIEPLIDAIYSGGAAGDGRAL